MAVLVLAVSTAAFAQKQEFGPSFSRYTVDIPAGWTAKSDDGGASVLIMNQAEDTFLTISVMKNNGMPVKEFIQNMVQKLNMQNAVIEQQDKNTYSATGTVQGQKVMCLATADDDSFAFFNMGGKDLETVSKIADSIEDK